MRRPVSILLPRGQRLFATGLFHAIIKSRQNIKQCGPDSIGSIIQ